MSDTTGTPKNLKHAIRQGFDRYMEDLKANGKGEALQFIGESVMEFLNNRVGAIQMNLETEAQDFAAYTDQGDLKSTMDMFDKFFKDIKI